MKRTSEDVGPRDVLLKRQASSSMFSVATNEGESESHDDLHANKNPQVIGAFLGIYDEAILRDSTGTGTTAAVCLGKTNGEDFFIEDDEDDEPSDPPKLPQFASESRFAGDGITEGVPIIREAQASQRRRPGSIRTGLVFESAARHFDRSNPHHKERELRVSCVRQELKESGLLSRCIVLGQQQQAGEYATTANGHIVLAEEDLARVHLPGYLERLSRLSTSSDEDLDREAEQYQSIYLTRHSYEEAKKASNALCNLVSRVVTGELDNGFAIVRPPGHHAEPGLAGGYCLLNHVAVAASYARYSKLNVNKSNNKLNTIERVMIVDWDVHHGNGTQQIFLDDPTVLYFSVHRWHAGQYYPFANGGGPSTTGRGSRNVNVGWTQKGIGDDEYRAVWRLLLLPMAREFEPDLILVSAGFDAADGDMGDCHVTPECFAELTLQLRTLAQGRIVCTLEGGYVRSVLSPCVTHVVRALLLDESLLEVNSTSSTCRESILESIDSTAAQNIRSTMEAHSSKWECLN